MKEKYEERRFRFQLFFSCPFRGEFNHRLVWKRKKKVRQARLTFHIVILDGRARVGRLFLLHLRPITLLRNHTFTFTCGGENFGWRKKTMKRKEKVDYDNEMLRKFLQVLLFVENKVNNSLKVLAQVVRMNTYLRSFLWQALLLRWRPLKRVRG